MPIAWSVQELDESVSFLFTSRHPIAWAMTVEKWISTRLDRLHPMDNRIQLWLAVMKLAHKHAVVRRSYKSSLLCCNV